MMWWVRNDERLAVELEAIEDLQANAQWLVRIKETLLKGLVFAVEFDIDLNGETLPFVLKYPSLFPDVPPSVYPGDDRRHSSHQYGRGGEMCLEYRSDNWDPSVTGAMMIASTHRLLSGEQPSLDERAVVPDAHRASLGQQLRSAKGRYLTTGRLPGVHGTDDLRHMCIRHGRRPGRAGQDLGCLCDRNRSARQSRLDRIRNPADGRQTLPGGLDPGSGTGRRNDQQV